MAAARLVPTGREEPVDLDRIVLQRVHTNTWTRVWLNGKLLSKRGRWHHALELPVGEHRVSLKNPGCKTEELVVKVGPRTSTLPDRHIEMKWLDARLEVIGPSDASVFYIGSKGVRALAGNAGRGNIHRFPMKAEEQQIKIQVIDRDGIIRLETPIKLRPNRNHVLHMPGP